MNIYISGISGTGMGALAELSADAGHTIFGSDIASGAITKELVAKNIDIHIGPQNGEFLSRVHESHPIDLFIFTSSLPDNHPELILAQKLGLETGKREKLINLILEQKNLKLTAISGTHGKTTTTAILIWIMHSLGQKCAHLVGSTLPFAPAGLYQDGAEYLVYEADEYDRNFLAFHPSIAIISSVSYDHPDTFPTKQDYLDAFATFRAKSDEVIENISEIPGLTLPGAKHRYDASLAITAARKMTNAPIDQLVALANNFPGSGRRFEKLAEGIYSDYAHHPEEISATIDMARDLAKDKQGLAVIYEPHQNTRQHSVRSAYRDAFKGADHIFWLPTFTTREDPDLPILTPADLTKDIENATPALLDDSLANEIKTLAQKGYLVLLMTAGPADAWLRSIL